MLVVPELEREVELLWKLRDTRKVFTVYRASFLFQCSNRNLITYKHHLDSK